MNNSPLVASKVNRLGQTAGDVEDAVVGRDPQVNRIAVIGQGSDWSPRDWSRIPRFPGRLKIDEIGGRLVR